jgi:hypothetical protein
VHPVPSLPVSHPFINTPHLPHILPRTNLLSTYIHSFHSFIPIFYPSFSNFYPLCFIHLSFLSSFTIFLPSHYPSTRNVNPCFILCILTYPHLSSSILTYRHLSSSIVIYPHLSLSILIHPHLSSSILIIPHPSSSFLIHPHLSPSIRFCSVRISDLPQSFCGALARGSRSFLFFPFNRHNSDKELRGNHGT